MQAGPSPGLTQTMIDSFLASLFVFFKFLVRMSPRDSITPYYQHVNVLCTTRNVLAARVVTRLLRRQNEGDDQTVKTKYLGEDKD